MMDTMPKQALYRHFDAAGQLLYVGISLCPFTRTRQHGMLSDWFDQVVRVEIERFDTRSQAEQAEYAAIRNERPIHNGTFNRKARLEGEAFIVLDANRERVQPEPTFTALEHLAHRRQVKVLERVVVRQAIKSH
jgi:hypothetical protein